VIDLLKKKKYQKKKNIKVLILILALKKLENTTEKKNFEYKLIIRDLVKSISLLAIISCIINIYYHFF